MEEAQLSERILEIFDDLTRAERLLAEHFLENPDSISLNTAQEISQLAGPCRCRCTTIIPMNMGQYSKM